MNIQKSTLVITTSGEDASATGTGTFAATFRGKVMAFFIDYSSGQAATTDVTIKHGPFTLLTVTSTATDGQYFPRVEVDDEAGTAITGQYDYFYLDGAIDISVAQADNGETVTVTVIVLED